jgi:hypothetical protein
MMSICQINASHPSTTRDIFERILMPKAMLPPRNQRKKRGRPAARLAAGHQDDPDTDAILRKVRQIMKDKDVSVAQLAYRAELHVISMHQKLALRQSR